MANAKEIKELMKLFGGQDLPELQQAFLYELYKANGRMKFVEGPPSIYNHYTKWRDDEAYQAVFTQVKRAGYKTLTNKAVDNLDNALESENENIRLNASKYVLDRLDEDFSPREIHQHEGGATTVYLDVRMEGEEPNVEFSAN